MLAAVQASCLELTLAASKRCFPHLCASPHSDQPPLQAAAEWESRAAERVQAFLGVVLSQFCMRIVLCSSCLILAILRRQRSGRPRLRSAPTRMRASPSSFPLDIRLFVPLDHLRVFRLVHPPSPGGGRVGVEGCRTGRGICGHCRRHGRHRCGPAAGHGIRGVRAAAGAARDRGPGGCFMMCFLSYTWTVDA